MADTLRRTRDETGTTLVELLVVIVLLSVVGAVTTTGIVRGFNAQLDATNVAETLDGMRIATQRVRDYLRGADEVCASSTPTTLVLWTDDDGDGAVSDSEKDIFELVGSPGNEVFQRRVPGTAEVQLIRDDIISGTLFSYDTGSALNQPATLTCVDGETVTDGPSLVRSVTVDLIVDHPDPDADDLVSQTVVQVRNAGLLEDPRDPPDAQFTADCPPATETCSFDASATTDSDGLVLQWLWDFGDGATGSGEVVNHTFSPGDQEYVVTLTAIDNDDMNGSTSQTVMVGTSTGNSRPTAQFTYSCAGRICDFDGSVSTDNTGISSYRWDLGDGTVVTEADPLLQHTYAVNDTYVVTLTVTDDDATAPKTDEETKPVTASTEAIRVESIHGVGSVVSGSSGTWEARFTVQLSFTDAGTPGAGTTISGKVKTSGFQNVSCSTDSTGRCTMTVSGIASNKSAEFTITSVNEPSGTNTYAADQNKASSLTVTKNQTRTAP